ncbi:hypothetical protein MKW98_028306 [Papaver atlanticum]|uniref:PNPLA domain-containing protein n=1 Tax=Papaver atlanticum TaxID=357466 RepID=A0AAD4XMP6_9MAGN|nr:hypothetical protein MKW98_028306 [Papaver atlanticum]
MSCVGCGGSGAGGDKCYFTSEISNGPQEYPQTTTQVLACIPTNVILLLLRLKRVITQVAVHAIWKLQVLLRNSTSNLTFQEAYDMVGRVLGVTVCSPMKHEPPRCLNYLASPHVVIWSAVTALWAFPGLFEAQELMAKDRSGEIVPYHPPFHLGPDEASSLPVRRWRDGSLESDLLMIQLKELLKEIVRVYGGNFAAKLAHLAEMEVKHRCHQLLELGFPLGDLAKLFVQDWEGDVTVVMPATLAQKLSAIKSNCGIELALDECVALLNHMRRLKRSSKRATASHGHWLASTVRFNASKRIPSWNCVARENSTGSLKEDVISEVVSQMHRAGGRSTGRNFRVHLNNHDGSDRVTVPPNIIIQMISRDSYYHSSSRVTTPDRNPEIVDWDQRGGKPLKYTVLHQRVMMCILRVMEKRKESFNGRLVFSSC